MEFQNHLQNYIKEAIEVEKAGLEMSRLQKFVITSSAIGLVVPGK